MDYNAKKYDSNAADVEQPAHRLIKIIKNHFTANNQNIQNDSLIIMDFGCGPGNTVQLLGESFPNSIIIGLDIDDEMIKFAQDKYCNEKNFKFFQQNLEQSWTEWPEKFRKQYINNVDVIFSNYSLHWLYNNYDKFNEILKNLLKSNNNGLFIGNLLYCGWLQTVTNDLDEINFLENQLSYPNEMEFITKFLWSLRSVGQFTNIHIEYYEPISCFNRKFYSESFIEIPLKWYRKFLKHSSNNEDIERLNQLLKRLILKQRIVNDNNDNDNDNDDEQVNIRQQLYIFKVIKN